MTTTPQPDVRTRAFQKLAARDREAAHRALALSAEAHAKALELLEISRELLEQSARHSARAERVSMMLNLDDQTTNPTQPTK